MWSALGPRTARRGWWARQSRLRRAFAAALPGNCLLQADPGVNGSASFNDSVVYRLVCQPDDVRVGATLGVLLNSSA